MVWTVFILVVFGTTLIAWALWLGFNLLIARWHGVAGLKITPAIARAFRPKDWIGRSNAEVPVDRSIAGGDAGV